MGSEFFCPYCHALLRKSPMDQAYSKLSGFVMTGNWQDTIRCPACGEDIDRMDIIKGKYDKKWWQFWGNSDKSTKPPAKKFKELSRAEITEIELMRMREKD